MNNFDRLSRLIVDSSHFILTPLLAFTKTLSKKYFKPTILLPITCEIKSFENIFIKNPS